MQTFRLIRTDQNADASALVSESLLLGRAHASEVQLPHPRVAAAHAGIKWHDGAFWLTALVEAPNGVVLLNNAAVQQAPLSTGDILRIGPYRLRLAVQEATLQITVEFALDLAEPEAPEPPLFAGTPADERVLERYWERRLQSAEAGGMPRQPLQAVQARPAVEQDGSELRRRRAQALAGGALLLMLFVVAAAWAFPQVSSPGLLSAAHQAKTLPAASTIANQTSGACSACHTLTGTSAQQCAACHTTPTFQTALGQTHLNLGLTCRACHAEHRGTNFKPALVSNTVCTNCHQTEPFAQTQNGQHTLHGPAVAYPVKNGLWLWDGVSQTAWQQHGLPGRTVEYNLRAQFHLLHGQGRAQGRTQCADCHLGGAADAALKQHVREACAQCHSLQPAFATALARLAETQPLLAGKARCVSCHAQHGAEKDLRASVRK
ncbi:MAG: cytochrome c3 family protein [Acidobacteria bacterium]|nr:cytochrome c3 family protein [Acidobacteriota bacterium]MBI3422447.1 cytochrome c3 family protein [Acidobacteriota bacterium]